MRLERELQAHTYELGRSICFIVEEPSLREIFAASFRDRVVHHLLFNFLEPVFEPLFIAQSYACRKQKGTHTSVQGLQAQLRKVTGNHRHKAYVLHLDIRGFFMSLDKQILFRLIAKRINNPELLWLTKLVIFSDPVKNFISKGDPSLFGKIPPHKSLFHVPEHQVLPIGNLTSQFFANVYLNELDQFIKHTLKAAHYLRYVDDFLLLSRDKQQLEAWRNAIISFLKAHLHLELNPKKQILQATDQGIDWLGYIIKPDCVLVRRRIVKNFKRKLFQYNRMLLPSSVAKPPIELIEKMLATVNAYFGHFGHANTFTLRKHLWDTHFQELRNYLVPKDGRYRSLRVRPDFVERAERARRY